ncbi:C69 family dipeptidase [Pseudomonas sp. 32.2.56]|uniref:C69 family dipeptidase n=1 Tax=Pseudomonas sp. 32.2.56 TaxID=2969303 RepID=UPI00214F8D93|nr:C69 family dipeptidase [Pseudomonas sp. 32.2.56]MCR4510707.1 C69 family dipeptidase [Pseudomonas sp. 32.2.56]
MCDTLVLRSHGQTWFAKNSDREAAEPQRLIRLPAVRGDRSPRVLTSYIGVPQTADRHGLVLSQPSWLWGGEMGVNDRGVAIGNEAVFTRLTLRQGDALLGMDLLRLGLERGGSAREALAVITEHLQAFGQGGAAGYRDKSFRYDNSFLLADADEAWVLETAGHLWAAKRVDSWAISNALTLGHEFDLHSPGLHDQARRLQCWDGKGDLHFAQAFDTRLLPWIGGAHQRRAQNQQWLTQCSGAPGFANLFSALRSHGQAGDDFQRHNNRQVCLHAGSFWRPSQTTASLVARLQGPASLLAATGTSAPCMSLFQPLSLSAESGTAVLGDPLTAIEQSLWWRFEPVHRRALVDRAFRQSLRNSRNALETQLWLALQQPHVPWAQLAAQARNWHRDWHSQALQGSVPLNRWWRRQAQL